VLPIGGLKSKILAAHLSGARVVILPKKNEKDLQDVPEEVRNKMKLVLVENMDQVLAAALRGKPKPLKPSPTTAGPKSTRSTATKAPVFPPEQPPAVA
jgi:ATP-dependent Lon protease